MLNKKVVHMNLIGHFYKYHIENTVKMFYSTCGFSYGDGGDDDFIVVRIKNHRVLCVVNIDGKRAVYRAESDKLTERDTACKSVYQCLVEITKHHPRWGMLTGVRPVKRVHKMLKEGYSVDDVVITLTNKFDVSLDKAYLATEVAKVQNTLKMVWEPTDYSLYVSIPFCPTRCHYCSFVSQSIGEQGSLIEPYLECLKQELKQTALLQEKNGLTLRNIYIGGGTPTVLNEKQLESLLKEISVLFKTDAVDEYTVEAGRADTINRDKLLLLKQHGVNRICINPQSLNDNVLEAIGRTHTSKQVLDVIADAKEVGFKSINMDFVAGLPSETIESFKQSLNKAIELGPENITIHTLSLKRASDYYNDGVETADVLRMNTFSIKLLSSNGYKPYYLYRQKNMLENLENIGWSRPGFESPYSVATMEENQNIIACGAGASTKIVGREKLERVFKHKYPADYCKNFDEILSRLNKTDLLIGSIIN